MTICIYMYGHFQIYLDGIEADLLRNVGHKGSRGMIFWERSYWFSTPWDKFCFLLFFCWGDFSHKKQINHTLDVLYCNRQSPPHLNTTMSSPVLPIKEGMNTKKHTKTKIRVGSVVKAKVG